MPPQMNYSGYPFRGLPTTASLIAALAFTMSFWPGQVEAQLSARGAPSQAYNGTFSLLYDGDYRAAGEEYEQLRRSGIRFGTASWIDSICYHAMIGECYYQMGNLDAALTNYTAALRLYLTFPDWMNRVQFSPNPIRPMQRNPQTPWGLSTRGAALGQYPQWMETLQGDINIGDQSPARRGNHASPVVSDPGPGDRARHSPGDSAACGVAWPPGQVRSADDAIGHGPLPAGRATQPLVPLLGRSGTGVGPGRGRKGRRGPSGPAPLGDGGGPVRPSAEWGRPARIGPAGHETGGL